MTWAETHSAVILERRREDVTARGQIDKEFEAVVALNAGDEIYGFE